ncbi:hypothetical protein N7495_004318 [Penicillium taxi]|uniref:uncharacterized protein n=1 Tax=Penicillium taxi TaxID=168475 RepID=UPI002544EDBA|nr:uncharacterized protein N7495_004318 [Penicillium taxi]KAJ5899574.1 hypothetical protein N7495_004318 [Penicillium taxi]
MPTGTSSPVKRPGLGRRAVSSHAVITRSNSNDLSQSHTSSTTTTSTKATAGPKSHRAHVVGGHRSHTRNPSVKNLAKLQRFQLPETTGRQHQRKKSAPVTPVASPPKTPGHVRWNEDLHDHPKNHSMKRNYSTPALRRNPSATGKKALVTGDRPISSGGKKKTVGFELGDDDISDDAEWEDTTQSPESTRRNSVAPSNPSLENPQVLIDPLTFVKRSYPQMTRATSLPDSIVNNFVRDQLDSDEEHIDSDDDQPKNKEARNGHDTEDNSSPPDERSDIANRLLGRSFSAKAPPAMSSISAMAKTTDSTSRNASSNNLTGQDDVQRTFSTTSLGLANIAGSQPNATSSSMEGGVSRFIVNNKAQASSQADSDPNTPSSFLPHYHPQTPPSPSKANPTASPAKPRGAEHSRTNLKLWLQRTATLNNSPPDNHGASTTVSTAVIDPMFQANSHQRPGTSAYDAGRAMNGAGGVSVPGQDTEARHIRKAYDKTSLELIVVRRFQSPTGDSFNRLRTISRAAKAVPSVEQGATLGKPVKSPSLPLLQNRKQSRLDSSADSKSYLPDPQSSTSDDQATNSESTDAAQATKSPHPSHRILSTSDEATHSIPGHDEEFPPVNETDMMMRRMWESREVASSA